uniref:Uncharacterized protein n=1 Tax=Pristionchus pacificus TaxID=54126 RepID=A0A2A6CVP5_PRIPA|eukprot:PDM82113.1 hypothetical protein PRIPAC_36506 [Pristionchus pacificus]
MPNLERILENFKIKSGHFFGIMIQKIIESTTRKSVQIRLKQSANRHFTCKPTQFGVKLEKMRK